MKQKVKYKGILFIVLSALCFAFMNMFVRMAGDLPAVQKSFFRNLVAFIIALATMVRHKEVFQVEKGNWKYMILRAGFGTLGILCNFYAVDHLVLSDASMLNKMSPFFAILFSILILKEKISLPQVVIVIGAFIGSLLILKPSGASLVSFPALIGLIGGMGAGFAYTNVRVLGEKGEKGPFVVAFFSGFSCLVTLPYLIFDFHPMSGMQLVYLLFAGLAAAGGQFSITAAYFHAPAKEISVYDYSQILFSAAMGFIVFGQIPDALSWIGYVLICAMAVAMFFYNNRKTS